MSRKSFTQIVEENLGIYEDGKMASSDATRQSPDVLPDAMSIDGHEGVPSDPWDDEVRPEDMQLGWDDLQEDEATQEVSSATLDAIERYADRLFAKVGIDVGFSQHFRQRVTDPRNGKPITPAELTRLFKQTFKKHGKVIPRLGDAATGVLRDMMTDINIPFALILDPRTGMLNLISKTVMRKKGFTTRGEVFAVEVDHPEYMPGGDEASGHDPTYDERSTQYNTGHPAP